MPRFAEQVEVAIEALSTNPPQAFEENEFIDASRLVYDGVRDIRKAVLMIRVCLLVYLNDGWIVKCSTLKSFCQYFLLEWWIHKWNVMVVTIL